MANCRNWSAAAVLVTAASVAVVCGASRKTYAGQQSTTAAQKNDSAVAQAVAEYAQQLTAALSGDGRQSLQSVFRAGVRAADALQQPDVPGQSSFMEKHSDAELQPLLAQMQGFHRSGEAGQAVQPDWEFFQKVAEQKGVPADQEFFALMQQTFAGGSFPAYTEPVTDYSACTKYGSGVLADFYGRWRAFAKKYPQAYGAEVQRVSEDIVSDLTSGTCACGDQASVVRELESFLARYPDDVNAPVVKARVDAVHRGQAGFHYQCSPG